MTIQPLHTDNTLTDFDHAQLKQLAAIGQVADRVASDTAFTKYHALLSDNTKAAHKRSLATFKKFLTETSGLDLENVDFFEMPSAWQPITYGWLISFQAWLLSQGYAVSTVNKKFVDVKTYAKKAFEAGQLSPDSYHRIAAVSSIPAKAILNVDSQRDTVRVSPEKTTPNIVSESQFQELWELGDFDSVSGTRFRLILALLYEHGLRISEVIELQADAFQNGQLSFERPKIRDEKYRHGLHKLNRFTRQAWAVWRDTYLPSDSRYAVTTLDKRFNPTSQKVKRSAMSKLIERYGVKIGIDNLSPHDFRHTKATQLAAMDGVGVSQICLFFGWSSAQRALDYIGKSGVDNAFEMPVGQSHP